MTMCEWNSHGTAGRVRVQYFLCILSTNIATEKVFIIFWFWLIILFIISFVSFGYYCIMFLNSDPNWRTRFLNIAFNSTKTSGSLGDKRSSEASQANEFLKSLEPSNFFFLYLLAQNVDYMALRKIVMEISKQKSARNSGLPGYRH